MNYKHWIGVGASILLGLFFASAGLGKLLQQAETFSIFLVPLPDFLAPAFVRVFLAWLPYVELIVGLLLIIGVAAKLVAVSSVVLIAGFIANNGWLLSHGLGNEPCGCLGMAERIIQARLSAMNSLYLDVVMLVLVSIILLYYQSTFFNIYPWFSVRDRIA